MSMENVADILAQHPFLRGLAPRHLAEVAASGSPVQFKAGDFLCRENEEASRFFVICQGRVTIEIFSARRGPVTIQTLGEDDVLGWLWFQKPYHWHLDARATQLTRVVALDVKALMARCEADHELGYELMKRYAHSLAVNFRVTKLQLMDIYGK
jgi:CRP-like cAMP-binding protein